MYFKPYLCNYSINVIKSHCQSYVHDCETLVYISSFCFIYITNTSFRFKENAMSTQI